MGSSIEAAITITAVIFILTAFIILPVGVFGNTFDFAKDTNSDFTEVDHEFSVEDFCTLMTGMSESFRIAIGGN